MGNYQRAGRLLQADTESGLIPKGHFCIGQKLYAKNQQFESLMPV